MPGLAYHARLHAAGVGLATLRGPENDAYLIKLLDRCDADKAALLAKGDDSPTNTSRAVADIMALAAKYCKQAADNDDAGVQNGRTVQTYRMAAVICEVVLSIEKEGAATAPATTMKDHATARADYLNECFKTGTPILPPGQEGAGAAADDDELAALEGGGWRYVRQYSCKHAGGAVAACIQRTDPGCTGASGSAGTNAGNGASCWSDAAERVLRSCRPHGGHAACVGILRKDACSEHRDCDDAWPTDGERHVLDHSLGQGGS